MLHSERIPSLIGAQDEEGLQRAEVAHVRGVCVLRLQDANDAGDADGVAPGNGVEQAPTQDSPRRHVAEQLAPDLVRKGVLLAVVRLEPDRPEGAPRLGDAEEQDIAAADVVRAAAAAQRLSRPDDVFEAELLRCTSTAREAVCRKKGWVLTDSNRCDDGGEEETGGAFDLLRAHISAKGSVTCSKSG